MLLTLNSNNEDTQNILLKGQFGGSVPPSSVERHRERV